MCFSNRLWFLAPWLKAVPGVAATVNQDLWSLCELQRDQTKKTSKKTKTSILNCSQPTSLIRFFHHQDVQICIGQKPLEMKLLLKRQMKTLTLKWTDMSRGVCLLWHEQIWKNQQFRVQMIFSATFFPESFPPSLIPTPFKPRSGSSSNIIRNPRRNKRHKQLWVQVCSGSNILVLWNCSLQSVSSNRNPEEPTQFSIFVDHKSIILDVSGWGRSGVAPIRKDKEQHTNGIIGRSERKEGAGLKHTHTHTQRSNSYIDTHVKLIDLHL